MLNPRAEHGTKAWAGRTPGSRGPEIWRVEEQLVGGEVDKKEDGTRCMFIRGRWSAPLWRWKSSILGGVARPGAACSPSAQLARVALAEETHEEAPP